MGIDSCIPDKGLQYGRADNNVDVVIIGAGISGMCTAIDMVRHGNGRNFAIIEKSSQVGGTWNDNVYPGCCCDVWGHLYSYSFEPNPDWSCEYPSQEEIHRYLINVAHKWHLYQHIRFNTAVEEARWDEVNAQWRVRVSQRNASDAHAPKAYTVTANFVVSAVGQLSIPKRPSIPGLDKFNGKVMHSARWDWDYNLEGKRVGVIGTGSTAAQIIPAVAPHARRLVVFQRSPTWVMPRNDAVISRLTRMGYRYVPGLLKRRRERLMDVRESHFVAGFNQKSEAHQSVSEKSRRHLQTQLAGSWNAELRCKLTPRYPFNCKRIIVSDDYYPSLTRDNVWLETTSISGADGSSVGLCDGRWHELDVIILATGFETTGFIHPIKVYGRNGHSLEAAWDQGAAAYLGITVNDFPNLGMLYGPNTNLAYNSLILQIEAQSQYINRLIHAVLSAKRKGQTLCIEPRADVVAEYNDEVQTRLAESTFADSRCNSWFKTASGKITNNWCGSAIEYQERTSVIDWADFSFEGSAAGHWQGRAPTRWKRVVEESQSWKRPLAQSLALMVSSGLAIAWYKNFGTLLPLTFG